MFVDVKILRYTTLWWEFPCMILRYVVSLRHKRSYKRLQQQKYKKNDRQQA